VAACVWNTASRHVGLIGFSNEFMNLTRGTGLISNIFDGYEPYKGDIAGRKNGVLISMDDGEIFTYALGKLDDRGRMFVKAGDPVYEGMIIGIHSRDNDLVVNATRTKQLTNFRVSRQGRRDQGHAADRPDAGIRGRVHRRRRTGRDHAQERARAQALPEGARPQARRREAA
jgi:predicted membrane GTPase involved in stress response